MSQSLALRMRNCASIVLGQNKLPKGKTDFHKLYFTFG